MQRLWINVLRPDEVARVLEEAGLPSMWVTNGRIVIDAARIMFIINRRARMGPLLIIHPDSGTVAHLAGQPRSPDHRSLRRIFRSIAAARPLNIYGIYWRSYGQRSR